MWPFTSRHDDSQASPAADAAPLLDLPTPPSLLLQSSVQDEQSSTPTPIREPFDLTSHPHQRLGMPPSTRLTFLCTSAFAVGFSLGATTGGRRAADRFRAENSHRFPTTKAGWYLYHRSKSYNTIVGGVKNGVKFGGQMAVWAALFGGVEEAMDRLRGRVFGTAVWDEDGLIKGDGDSQRDFLNSLVAGMSTVGVYVAVKRMDVFAAGKMARMAFRWSMVYGLVQDGLATVKGEAPGYVRWAMGKSKRKDDGLV
jgi:hypothetical protein